MLVELSNTIFPFLSFMSTLTHVVANQQPISTECLYFCRTAHFILSVSLLYCWWVINRSKDWRIIMLNKGKQNKRVHHLQQWLLTVMCLHPISIILLLEALGALTTSKAWLLIYITKEQGSLMRIPVSLNKPGSQTEADISEAFWLLLPSLIGV